MCGKYACVNEYTQICAQICHTAGITRSLVNVRTVILATSLLILISLLIEPLTASGPILPSVNATDNYLPPYIVTEAQCMMSSVVAPSTTSFKFVLAASSHPLDNVPYGSPVYFLLRQGNLSGTPKQLCSLESRRVARMVLDNAIVDAEVHTTIPLFQDAFLTATIDHRNRVEQTRAVNILVRQVAPGMFFFPYTPQRDGVVVFTMELALHSPNSTDCNLGLIGGSCARTTSFHGCMESSYSIVARFWTHIAQTKQITESLANCSYADGIGEWSFPFQRGPLDGLNLSQLRETQVKELIQNITATPRLTGPARYVLTGCTEAQFRLDLQAGKDKLNKWKKVCMLGDSQTQAQKKYFPAKLIRTDQTFLVSPGRTKKHLTKCGPGQVDAFLYSLGSHCQDLNIPTARKYYPGIAHDVAKLAKHCAVVTATTFAYPSMCPERFGDGQRVRRNYWRIQAKNVVWREASEKEGLVFVDIAQATLAIQDLTHKGTDCIHFRNRQDSFNVYRAMVDLTVAAIGVASQCA